MPVVNVTKQWSGRPGEKANDRRSYSDGYEVLTDSVLDDQTVVVGAPGLPPLGSGFPGDGFATLKRLQPRPRGPLFWVVEAIYETEPLTGVNPDPNPLNAPPEIRIGTTKSIEPIDHAIEDMVGNANVPITNTAYDPFNNVTVEIADPVMVVTRNKQIPGGVLEVASIVVNYVNTTNSDFFYSQPGQARMAEIDAQYVYAQPFDYWRFTYMIQFRKGNPVVNNGPGGGWGATTGGPARAWWKRFANRGKAELEIVTVAPNPPMKQLREITDSRGITPSGLYNLDAFGMRLAADQTRWLEYKVMYSANFSALGIL